MHNRNSTAAEYWWTLYKNPWEGIVSTKPPISGLHMRHFSSPLNVVSESLFLGIEYFIEYCHFLFDPIFVPFSENRRSCSESTRLMNNQ